MWLIVPKQQIMTKIFTSLFVIISTFSFAQNADKTQQVALQKLYQQFRTQEKQDSIKAVSLEETGKAKIIEIDKNGEIIGLVGFSSNGFPVFYDTDNRNASKTVGTNLVVAGATNGYGLTGNGMVIGEWDGGEVRGTHQEYSGRVTQVDNPSSMSDHSTHVCGTMIASGVMANAKGMATAATVSAHDFFSDGSEMTTFATTGLISNHSYGTITGWRLMNSGTWRWYGDTTISGVEDYQFGFYTNRARSWDLIANAAPNYLIVKSAGNDRNDVPPAGTASHEVWDNAIGWVNSTVNRPQDGGVTGFDCISSNGNAKNILTVGAVNDVTAGWAQASDVVMSSFSGWGPTDDGRIKPDIVANGVFLRSTGKASNTDYYSSSGTSMSAPNATGSMALLQEMYNDSHSVFMNASSLKALVIHTANEAGINPGPDFSFGWGLLNIKGAADLIADTVSHKIIATSISNNGTTTFSYYSDGTQDVEATIVWNDPAGTAPTVSLDPTTIILVNDLDLRISGPSGTIKMPWHLNSAMPSLAATKADNTRDNVEKVVFDNPIAGLYTFTVSHKGTLAANQNFSIVISGLSAAPIGPTPIASFTGTPTSICEGNSVTFTNTSTGNPTGLEWTFTGGTPSSSTLPSPVIVYSTAGTYDVKLKATNANGFDIVNTVGYITVLSAPNTSTQPIPDACVSGNTITLSGGLPTGGTWTGTGVVAGVFDPAIAGLGVHTLTYTVTNGTCSSASNQNVSVNPPPTVSLPNFAASICTASAPFTLIGGTPLGGIYTGIGVSNNIFDPAVAGLGAHVITYTFTNANGCSGSDVATLNVVNGIASSIGSFSDVCKGSGLVTLTGGSPAGGSYSGTGVNTTTGVFDPAIAGIGTHTITYFGPGGLCVSAATSSITVNPLPNVSLGAFNDECSSVTAVTLTGGLPTGGIYSGNNVSAGSFNPSAAGIGIHTIYYSFTDANTCTKKDSNKVNVVNSIQYLLGSVSTCEGDNAFTITSGTPSGGQYFGTGIVNGNTFDPVIAGVGTHTISYNNTSNTCASPGFASFMVTAIPTVTLAPITTICATGGPVTLSGGMPIGGTYSGIGITNGVLDPTVNGVGTMTVTYTYEINGCSASSFQLVTIGISTPTILNIATSYCINENSITLVGDPIGGTFSGSGITGSVFDPNAAGVGTHTITYTTTGGCAGSKSYGIEVNPKPIIGNITGPLISSQNIIAAYSVAAQNGSFYSWVPNGGTIISNSNNQITVRWNTNATGSLLAVIHDQNGCTDTARISVNLWPVGINDVSAETGIRFYPNPVQNEILFSGNLITDGALNISIINGSGQEVMTQSKNTYSGTFNWTFNVSKLSTGTYFFSVSQNNELVGSGQFIKQ